MKIKSLLSVALLLAVISLAFPMRALASEEHGCTHEPTVQALRGCVVHAANAGHIDSLNLTKSLLAQLDAAQAALDRGQTDVAVKNLLVFVQTVEAQAGKHIVAEHAAHLVGHAQEVVTALSQ